MAKITALDFVKKVSLDSDDIPVEIRDAEGILIAAEKKLMAICRPWRFGT